MDTNEFLKSSEPTWKKALFLALTLRKSYLELTKTLPSRTPDLRSFPTSKTLAILRDPENNEFNVTPEHKGMEYIAKFEDYYKDKLKDINRAASQFRRKLSAIRRAISSQDFPKQHSITVHCYGYGPDLNQHIDELRIWSNGKRNPSFNLQYLSQNLQEFIETEWLNKLSQDERWGLVCPYDFAICVTYPIGDGQGNLEIWFFCGGSSDVVAVLGKDEYEVLGTITDSIPDIQQAIDKFIVDYSVEPKISKITNY